MRRPKLFNPDVVPIETPRLIKARQLKGRGMDDATIHQKTKLSIRDIQELEPLYEEEPEELPVLEEFAVWRAKSAESIERKIVRELEDVLDNYSQMVLDPDLKVLKNVSDIAHLWLKKGESKEAKNVTQVNFNVLANAVPASSEQTTYEAETQ